MLDAMTLLEVIFWTVIYTLIATRVAIVLSRHKAKNHPKDKQNFTTIVFAILWPLAALMFGFLLLMIGGDSLAIIDPPNSDRSTTT